ncbi:MAG: hypothetical protein CMP22_07645 [Rickettsiales bacterium]|nr:hypothetical protein [Rickettsiales bacterium]
MNEKPILFNAEMVQAILSGQKTQTRRIIKPQPGSHLDDDIIKGAWEDGFIDVKCPYGKIRDQLWVRENTYADHETSDSIVLSKYFDGTPVLIKHDGHDAVQHWSYSRDCRPSIHMERKSSRIQLEIKDVRVERLQDICEEDAIDEGIDIQTHPFDDASYYCKNYLDKEGMGWANGFANNGIKSFQSLWQSINGEESWANNPWVWVVKFERIKP